MNKTWKIIKYEYTRHVLRKRFLFALLSVPLWVLFMVVVSVLAIFLGSNNTPVGYVDQSGLLKNPQILDKTRNGPLPTVDFVAYPDEASARSDLNSKSIQAYYILPSDFLQTRDARLIYLKEPDNGVQDDFESFLRLNLMASQPPEIAKRIAEGPNVSIHATEEGRSLQSGEWFKVAAPIAAGILLIISVFTSGGYLMHAVVEEKENRTMEILATSVSPMQIMAGKIVALIGVGVTQILVWSLFPLVIVSVAVAYIPTFSAAVDWGSIGVMFLLIIPTFIMISALMAAIGATVTEAREGQQVTGLFTIPVMAPYMLMSVLISNPGSPIALFLSFFPLTAALTVLIRMGFASVPIWQSWLSIAILLLSSIGALWLAGRLFRVGMLRYGQRMRWKDIVRSLRSST